MRRKIRADHTMRKNRKTFRTVPTAANTVFPTGFAPLAANTKAKHLSRLLKIGVDLMGNDNVPSLLLDALKEFSLPADVEILAIGTPEFAKNAPFPYLSADQAIGLEEHPLLALRRKRNASMTIGLRLLKEGKIDALVSAGNTGALVSSAKMILSTLKGILRPALLTLMPTKKNPVAVLDVGANVQVKARHLVQFALIGAAYQKTRGIENPTVGLLNIGSEPLKGTSELRLAYQILRDLPHPPFHFAGNIEGTSVFDGNVDVLITDGFTGNIFLKTAEGIASLILDKIQTHIPPSQIQPFQSLHYSEYPGALLAGVRGLVIKCHSYSSPPAFLNALHGAITLAKSSFVQKLSNVLS
jgi:glycerol-3-phosphate acyltransferase PlsX